MGWLMTFSDMVTLLLCFFVLLNIMSTLDVEKFKQLMANLRGSPDIFTVMDNTHKQGSTGLQTAPDIPSDMFSDPTDWWGMTGEEIIAGLAGAGYDNTGTGDPSSQYVVVIVDEARIVIRCQGEVLFDTLSDRLKPEGVEVLGDIVEIGIMPHWEQGKISELHVEGHADIRQIPSANPIRSNMLLSAMRAETALNYIVSNFDIAIERTGAVGYGEWRPIPEIGVGTSEAEWAQNRRVEFVLYRNFLYDEDGTAYEMAA
jgi:chemotaxis protein MotB